MLGLLHARHAIDTLLVRRNVGCDVADAVGVRLNHHLVGDFLAVEQHGVIMCIELSTSRLGDGAAVKNEVLKVADRTQAASCLNVCVAQG